MQKSIRLQKSGRQQSSYPVWQRIPQAWAGFLTRWQERQDASKRGDEVAWKTSIKKKYGITCCWRQESLQCCQLPSLLRRWLHLAVLEGPTPPRISGLSCCIYIFFSPIISHDCQWCCSTAEKTRLSTCKLRSCHLHVTRQQWQMSHMQPLK